MKKRRKYTRKRKKPKQSQSNGTGRKYDFLYLLERVSGKSRRSKVLGELEVKFGVTNKAAKDRKDSIDEDMPGEVVLITWIYIPGRAKYYEDKLLKKWDRRLNPKGTGPSAGRTEWRRVTWLEYTFILGDYWAIKNRTALTIIKIILFLLTILIFNYDKLKNITQNFGGF